MKTIDDRAERCVRMIRASERAMSEHRYSQTAIDADAAEWIATEIRLAITAERRRVKREARKLPRGAS